MYSRRRADGSKVVLAGEYCVGKTAIFRRFVGEDGVPLDLRSGHEYCVKKWAIGNREVSMTLVDPEGIRRYGRAVEYEPLYHRMKALLLVYSIDNENSLSPPPVHAYNCSLMALVGNKCDLEEKRVIEPTIVDHVASALEINPDMVFEVSAKTGEGCQEMFDVIALKMAADNSPQCDPSPAHPPKSSPCLIQ